jgi:arylsulfatase A-like enzyme
VGAVAGVAGGAAAGWHQLEAGYPLLLADALRRWLAATLPAAAGFLLAFELLWAPLTRLIRGRRRAAPGSTRPRRLPSWAATAAAAALAGAPLLAWAGYLANRSWGIRPAELLAPYALKRNLALVAAGAAAWAVAALALHRRRDGGRPPGRPRLRTVLAATLVAAVLALHLGVAAAFRRDIGGGRPNVIVLLIDALRADHLGCYGYARPTSPAIDRLAGDGVLFREAIPASTFTKSSVASLFTGRFPYQHGVYWGNLRENPERITSDLLGGDEVTLAEVLRGRGWLTAAWVQNSHLRDFMGFAQGFVDYHDQEGPIDRINRRFGAWLAGPGRRYPFFAYVHYIDLHDPYRPPPPYDALFGDAGDPRDAYAGIDLAEWGSFLAAVRRGERRLAPAELDRLAALYDGQIRHLDDRVGRLLDRLRRLGLYDRSLIVLTADHGDAFGEHGFISHSAAPYEELVRVPLIVKFPGGRFAGRTVGRQARLVDLFPTVLEVAGVGAAGAGALAGGPPADLAGCSLVPLIEGGAQVGGAGAGVAEGSVAGRDPACEVAVVEIAEEGAPPIVAIRAGGWKYIHRDPAPGELYDLAADPGETRNLIATAGEEAAALRRLALEVVARRSAVGAQRIPLDERTLRELKALGYVGE